MGTNLYDFRVMTSEHTQMIDITDKVQAIVTASGIQEGLCTVFVPHTTAAVTINENSAAHLKASMMGFSESIIVSGGNLVLGTWQGIYFLEYDGSRNRKVLLKITEG